MVRERTGLIANRDADAGGRDRLFRTARPSGWRRPCRATLRGARECNQCSLSRSSRVRPCNCCGTLCQGICSGVIVIQSKESHAKGQKTKRARVEINTDQDRPACVRLLEKHGSRSGTRTRMSFDNIPSHQGRIAPGQRCEAKQGRRRRAPDECTSCWLHDVRSVLDGMHKGEQA